METKMNISIENLMTTNLTVLHPKDRLQKAKDIFDAHDIHHIPIVEDGQLKGILSQGDIMFLEGIVTNSFDEFLRTKKYQMTKVEELMTSNPYYVNLYHKIDMVLDLMIEKRVNCIPVVSDDQLVGLITSRDILKYLASILD